VVGGGLSTLVRSLAIAFGQYAITVNGIIPGQLNTARRTTRKNTDRASGRQADLSDIMGPIAYLASRDTTYLTGEVILVDGGLSLRTALPGSR
jgi:3-oxoacyl-[acyl-carrier protein] reductase